MWVVVIATVVGSTVGACSGLVVLAALQRRQAAPEGTGSRQGAPPSTVPVTPGLPRRDSAGGSAPDEVTTPLAVRPAPSPGATDGDGDDGKGPRPTRPMPTSLRPLPVRPVTGPVAAPAPAPSALRAGRPAPRPGPPPVPGPRPDPRSAPAVAPAARPALTGDEIALVSTTGLLFRVRSGAVLGRSRGCRVRLADARVSRQHAVLYKARGGWWIGDLGSTNGTVVDGVPVQGAAPVREGATVVVGGRGGVVLMALRAVEASRAGSPTAA